MVAENPLLFAYSRDSLRPLREISLSTTVQRRINLVDLRQASTLFSQDNKIYPLSFAENIGLGCLSLASDMDLIEKAAEQGGAAGFISKLDTAYSTNLDPECSIISMNLQGKPDHPLQKEVDKLPKKTNISGGETQRLVA